VTRSIACVVEGHGDRQAVPLLVRRIAAELCAVHDIEVQSPLRVPRDRLLKPGEIERAVSFAGARVAPDGGVLIVIDADDDCPAELGPALLGRARTARSDVEIAVVIAKREYESWLIAAAPSLAGARGLPPELETPDDPEGIRGAKEWLRRRMGSGRTYSETTDQAALTARIDLDAAQVAPSFRRCVREVTRLVCPRRGGAEGTASGDQPSRTSPA
jgi:hypothetical protein